MRKKVRLSDLAFACYVFQGFEKRYGDAYEEFWNKTSHDFDMQNASHRTELLIWLNAWGCRQFELNSRDKISEELRDWFRKYGILPPEQKLIDLSDEEIADAAKVYDTLERLKIPCSIGKKTVGPTGASKILFAMRRNIYPIWDNAMRIEYRKVGCSTYREYMKYSRNELLELSDDCQRNGFELSELPRLLSRERESLLKFLDEYHWVVITRKLPLPSAGELQKWCEWNSEETKPINKQGV